MQDVEFSDAVRDACSKDPLFFINGFGWTLDPRCQPFPKLPLVLYPCQEEAILEVILAINDHDILIEKSRDMGASWICIAAIEWCWLFRSLQSFLFVSRVEDYVDKPGNPKALFYKFDFLLDNLPLWLRPRGYDPEIHRKSLHAENPENDSVVDGESTQKNVARGDRRTAILLDEFAAVRDGERVLASTRDATRCRIFNSTPDPETGTNNAFYAIRQSKIKKLRLHWSQHPVKSVGLYTTETDGTLKVLERAGYPKDYKPILDAKIRSPWYDLECERAGSKREIATELDIDYLGSGGQYFDVAKVQEMIRRDAMPPFNTGDLDYDKTTGESTEFRESIDGKLKLWFQIGKNSKPSINTEHRLVGGSDISAGTGASNSCVVFWDEATCEKLAEYVNPYLRPEAFALQVFAISRWLGNPRLIWENGGPGRQFGSKIIELGYSNYYLHKRDEAISGKVTDIPGVAQTRETKTTIMSSYRAGIENGSCINHSKEALEDALEYVFAPDGCPIHSAAKDKIDPSGARSNHGDRAMADALAWKLIKDNVIGLPKPEEPKIPIGSLAWRNKMREDQEKVNSNNGW